MIMDEAPKKGVAMPNVDSATHAAGPAHKVFLHLHTGAQAVDDPSTLGCILA